MTFQPAADTFHYCPQCAAATSDLGSNPFVCSACGYRLHFGPTVAVGAIICNQQGQVLLLRRARDPGKGKLGLPGGFVDAGETGEVAVARETLEEVGLNTTSIAYLTTFVNTYQYCGISIPVLDLFYVCRVPVDQAITLEKSEVADYLWSDLNDDDLNQMAFKSNLQALTLYSQQRQP